MKKYIITIEETVVQNFEIFAENEDEAYEIAKEKYRKGEIVLEPGELQYKQMAINTSNDEISEWIEF